jgi:thiaminase/transcriptional activator TenA
MDSYGRAFSLWRASATEVKKDIWHAYTHHAFVQKLGNGTLPREAYIQYLVQDYVFLVHFSRAWALAVVKSETLSEMKHAAATVDALVNIEMQHHVDICAGYGIDEQALYDAVEEPENLSYTRYVLDAGLSGDLADLLAALAPCIFGYGEIGAKLAKQTTDDNPYAEWIETYASESYQQVCREVGELIDAALERRIGVHFADSPRWERLTERFMTASRLEAGFWSMALK